MGRGRAKAKQTKVARELKYRPTGTDFASLERELRSDAHPEHLGGEIPEAYADEYGDEDADYDETETDGETSGLRKSG